MPVVEFKELYKAYREQVEHENQLHNNRIHWLILIQAILFATFGLLMQPLSRFFFEGAGQPVDQHKVSAALFMATALVIISILAIFVAATCFYTLSGSSNAVKEIRKDWNRIMLTEDVKALSDFSPMFPHVSGSGGNSANHSFLRSRNIPVFFIAAWVALMISGSYIFVTMIPSQ
jgi:magnesium-transporting ATPase (P-type)